MRINFEKIRLREIWMNWRKKKRIAERKKNYNVRRSPSSPSPWRPESFPLDTSTRITEAPPTRRKLNLWKFLYTRNTVNIGKQKGERDWHLKRVKRLSCDITAIPIPHPVPVEIPQKIEIPIPQPQKVPVEIPHPYPVEVVKHVEVPIEKPEPVIVEKHVSKKEKGIKEREEN